ncbi:unannotated protein [freshwater metagenome]|uniref:Unannotated protein n=1 Tax=freshwater metagenome TaxID=449393 RepID=A0A6J6DBA2_9ZZZZ
MLWSFFLGKDGAGQVEGSDYGSEGWGFESLQAHLITAENECTGKKSISRPGE